MVGSPSECVVEDYASYNGPHACSSAEWQDLGRFNKAAESAAAKVVHVEVLASKSNHADEPVVNVGPS